MFHELKTTADYLFGIVQALVVAPFAVFGLLLLVFGRLLCALAYALLFDHRAAKECINSLKNGGRD